MKLSNCDTVMPWIFYCFVQKRCFYNALHLKLLYCVKFSIIPIITASVITERGQIFTYHTVNHSLPYGKEFCTLLRLTPSSVKCKDNYNCTILSLWDIL